MVNLKKKNAMRKNVLSGSLDITDLQAVVSQRGNSNLKKDYTVPVILRLMDG